MVNEAADKPADKNDTADKKKVEKDHAATGRPLSPTEDPTDHSVGGNRAAAAQEDAEKLEEDNSLAGKIRKSELFLVTDHSVGGDPYVGISPQNDPKATQASKLRSAVFPLAATAPRTGMQIRPKDGDAFAVGDGFGPDSVPADWSRVTRPDGKPFFA